MNLSLTIVSLVVEIPRGKVDMIEGKEVDTVSVATTQVDNIEFSKYFSLNQFVGFSSRPHNFNTQDTVNISGLSNYYKGFDGSYQIGVRSDTFVTTIGIGTTGALVFPHTSMSLVLWTSHSSDQMTF